MRSEPDAFARVRAAIRNEARASDLAGLSVAVSVGTIYAVGLGGFCLLRSWLRWPSLGVAAFCAGSLFIVGHDACHLSLVRSARLNRLIGRIAFAPTLHPFSAWEIGHNRRHHGHTNLRYVDYVWCPWSAEEYAAASASARFLYRLYHTPLGIGLYYPIEIWFKHMWGSDARDAAQRDYARVRPDRAWAALGFLTIVAGLAALAIHGGRPFRLALVDAALGALVPLAVFQYLMSIVIFIHHRHPDVVWHDSAGDYDPFRGQIRGTVHATLPRPLELAFLDIFSHTAHHANARIPLYRLSTAQAKLETLLSDCILRTPLTVRTFLQILRKCQLYDYERRAWRSIAGSTRLHAGLASE